MNSVLTRKQSRRIDQLAIERLQIPGIVLMENAGIHASSYAPVSGRWNLTHRCDHACPGLSLWYAGRPTEWT